MALVPGLPAPVPKWVKVLIKVGEAAGWFLLEELMDHHTQAADREDVEWRRLIVRVQRATPSGTEEDYATMSFDIVNITGGQVDKTWTSADFISCEAAFDEWLTSIKTYMHSSHTVTNYVWYRMRFRETMTPTHRFEDTGPPVRNQAKTIVGTNVGIPLPYQCAISVTERTGVPRHWGRFYIPGFTAADVDATPGRLDTPTATVVSNVTAELYDDLQGNEFYPVVPVTQVNKVLAGGLLLVNQIQVDDIPDVIRRRRPRQAKQRIIGVPTP